MTKQQAFLLREDDLPRADRGNGATTTRFVNRSCGSQSMINGITTIPPKGTIPPHYHNCEDSVLVLSGTGRAVVGEIELAVKTGDVTWIPDNLPHQFLNGSAADSMRIFWTYASAGAARTMVETGETHLIDAEHKA
jgi:quercetin dioxygenase-like cupin family protein